MSQKIYQMITDRIVTSLNAGVIPWRKTWTGGSEGFPANFKNKRPYRGVNVLILGFEQMDRGYKSRFWLTFKQAKAKGGSVRKGEKGTPVIFWKLLKKPDPDKPGKEKTIPLLRYYTVFNVDQCDGVEDPTAGKPVKDLDFTPIQACEKVVKGYEDPPSIGHDSQAAWYRPADDHVNMPKRETFESEEAYYSTLFHELTHSTGHASRLKRGLTGVVGVESYSKEELCAEMGAAMLCGVTGIANDRVLENAASYIANWRAKLSDDPKLVIQAAAQAQKACDLILGTKFDQPSESE